MSNGLLNMQWSERYPCLDDKTATTSFDRHYVYHTAWAARKLSQYKPKKHIDIGSCLRFSTIVSAFVPVDVYDYRPPLVELSNLFTGRADLMSLPFESNSVESLSCMHVVEHVGLGRYGDPLDPFGDKKAVEELKRVIKDDGLLMFVVPIATKACVKFNAHRIYDYESVLKLFSGFELMEFSLIPDDQTTGIVVNPPKELLLNQVYACGCFLFKGCKKEVLT